MSAKSKFFFKSGQKMYNKRSYKTNHERRKIKEVRIYTKKQKKYVSYSVRKRYITGAIINT